MSINANELRWRSHDDAKSHHMNLQDIRELRLDKDAPEFCNSITITSEELAERDELRRQAKTTAQRVNAGKIPLASAERGLSIIGYYSSLHLSFQNALEARSWLDALSKFLQSTNDLHIV